MGFATRARVVGEVGVHSAVACAGYSLYRASGRRLLAKRLHAFSQSLCFAELLRSRHDVAGMTSFDERAYCSWYARKLHTGAGAVVDLGCWLGATTVPLAAGLSRNPAAGSSRIEAYDLFRWEDWMDPHVAGTSLEGRFQVGDDFSDELRRRVAEHGSVVRVHATDLTETPWAGGPIEFLLVDAMKSWQLGDAIARNFFPALLPGRSIVLHQDFAHWYTPWIHVLQYRLREHFEPVYDLPRSDGMAFRSTRTVNLEDVEPLTPSSVSVAELEAAIQHSLAHSGTEKTPNILAAKAKFFVDGGDFERAERELQDARAAGHASPSSDIGPVEDFLRERKASVSSSGTPLSTNIAAT